MQLRLQNPLDGFVWEFKSVVLIEWNQIQLKILQITGLEKYSCEDPNKQKILKLCLEITYKPICV